MYKRPRIIPCLTMQDQDLVKTINFAKPRYVGDPINTVKIFNNKDVDEISIIDISATAENREPNYDYLHEIASEAFMPLGYGGGIKSLEQARKIFKLGYEKVILNSLFIESPETVREIVQFAGSQSVVASIDYRLSFFKKEECMIYNARKRIPYSLEEYIGYVTELGAGEILLNSIDQDGTMNGYQTKVIEKVARRTSVPLIACGGAGSLDDVRSVLDAGADAAAAGSFFIYYGKNKAVLIHTPSEEDYLNAGIFEWD